MEADRLRKIEQLSKIAQMLNIDVTSLTIQLFDNLPTAQFCFTGRAANPWRLGAKQWMRRTCLGVASGAGVHTGRIPSGACCSGLARGAQAPAAWNASSVCF